MREGWRRFDAWFQSLSLWNRSSFLFCVLLLAVTVVELLGWPIVMLDTDTWYHLNTGRYILTHHHLPHDSYFSFIDPPRSWIDYYWLFQVLIYQLYVWGGYPALIVLRAALYAATCLVLLGLLFTVNEPSERRHTPWWTVIFVCCATLLLLRGLNVRPHLFSYLFLSTFLYIYECRPRLSWCLPLLTILWANLHGIAYPVIGLMVGAYLLEGISQRLLRRPARGPRIRPSTMWASLACVPAVLITPHGTRLLPVPFHSTAHASEYIREMVPVPFLDVLSPHIAALAPAPLVFFSLLAGMTVLVAIVTLGNARWRVSHLLLYVGGLVLVTKGFRFLNECVLLSLPLVRAHPLTLPSGTLRALPKPAYLLLVGGLMVMPMRYVLEVFRQRPAYPLSTVGLPAGVARFLQQVDVGGTVLNEPNVGGYLQWMVYPRYQIFIDMEVVFLFSDEDVFVARHVFLDPHTLRVILQRYDPTFLAVPIAEAKRFPQLIREHPQYVLIWCDDVDALYVDQRRHPQLVDRFGLKVLDPFLLAEKGADDMIQQASSPQALLAEINRLLALDPTYRAGHQIAGLLRGQAGQYELVLRHAQALRQAFPEFAVGYGLQGDGLRGLGRYREAVAAYQAALQAHASDESEATDIRRHLAETYLAKGVYRSAYQIFRSITPLYADTTTAEDLYRLGVVADLAGLHADAETAFRYLYRYRLVSDDVDWTRRVRNALQQMGIDVEVEDPSSDVSESSRP